jgi:hypothetical protein
MTSGMRGYHMDIGNIHFSDIGSFGGNVSGGLSQHNPNLYQVSQTQMQNAPSHFLSDLFKISLL